MKVFAIHDLCRAALRLYVEVDEQPDGTRSYLTRGLDGEERVEPIAPACEAPSYMVVPLAIATQVAAELVAGGRLDEVMEVETLHDLVDLVTRAQSVR